MRKYLLAAAILFPAFLAGNQAGAVTVTFSSDGAWGGTSGCSQGCATNGNVQTIGQEWQYTGPRWDQTYTHTGPDSTLTAVDMPSTTTSTPQNDFKIGEIDWVNSPTNVTDSNFNLNYSLTISFTAPGNATKTATMTLNIQQPTNPPGDSVTQLLMSNLSPLDFSFAGLTVSDVKFKLDPNYNQHGATYDPTSGVWFNPESNTSHLLITADFTATATPEPASLALLGAGLVGLGGLRRSRKRG